MLPYEYTKSKLLTSVEQGDDMLQAVDLPARQMSPVVKVSSIRERVVPALADAASHVSTAHLETHDAHSQAFYFVQSAHYR